MNSSRVAHNAVPVVGFDANWTSIAEIGNSMYTALTRGNAVVSIATGTHRRLLEGRLTVQHVDTVAALSTQQYVPLNALEALSMILIDDTPDVIRFAEVIGALIDRAAANYPRVLIFTELVPLMQAQGKYAGAAALEKLLRSFVASRPCFVACEHPGLAIQSFSSISLGHRAVRREIPRTWSDVESNAGSTLHSSA